MPNTELKISVNPTDKTILLQGRIEKNCPPLLNLAIPWTDQVCIDLAGVLSIDQEGAIAWKEWLGKVMQGGRAISLRNIPQVMVEKMLLYKGCLPGQATIESFEVPFYCKTCRHSFAVLLSLGKDYFQKKPLPDPERAQCPRCQADCAELVEYGSYFNLIPEFELNTMEIFDSMQVGILLIDEQKRIVCGNEFAANLLKSSVRRLMKRELFLMDLIKFKSEKLRFIEDRPANDWSERQIQETEFELKDGGKGTVQMFIRRDARSTGFRQSWLLYMHDVSLEIALKDKYKSEEQGKKTFETMATTDKMTGLNNFRSFISRFQVDIRQAKENLFALGLVIMDIDFFKKFNDTYGHLQGDEVLRVVAGVLRENIREHDFVARYGGEEFVFLIKNVSEENLLKCIEKVRIKVSEKKVPHLTSPGQELTVTASFGGVSIRGQVLQDLNLDNLTEDQVKEYVAKADKNLYSAKEKGRNCCVVTTF